MNPICSSVARAPPAHVAALQAAMPQPFGTGPARATRLMPRPLGNGPLRHQRQWHSSGPINRSAHQRAAGRSQVFAGASEQPLQFVIYTKPECPLCQGLEEKVQALIDQGAFLPTIMSQATLELRNINTNEEWKQAYDMQVPVLARLAEDGTEVFLPRPSPRLNADRLLRHIEKAVA